MKIEGAHVVFHRMLSTSKCNRYFVRAVLLTKRTLDAPMHAGCWGLIGGKVKDRERPKTAARREANEELGIRPASLAMLCDVAVDHGKRNASGVRYFSAALNFDMDKLRLKRNREEHKVEGEGLAWFSAEEVHHLMMRPEDRIAVATFFKKHGT
jgi:8-oxo-dGTP pyrophosphatase MutT (NUDIX family)